MDWEVTPTYLGSDNITCGEAWWHLAQHRPLISEITAFLQLGEKPCGARSSPTNPAFCLISRDSAVIRVASVSCQGLACLGGIQEGRWERTMKEKPRPTWGVWIPDLWYLVWLSLADI